MAAGKEDGLHGHASPACAATPQHHQAYQHHATETGSLLLLLLLLLLLDLLLLDLLLLDLLLLVALGVRARF